MESDQRTDDEEKLGQEDQENLGDHTDPLEEMIEGLVLRSRVVEDVVDAILGDESPNHDIVHGSVGDRGVAHDVTDCVGCPEVSPETQVQEKERQECDMLWKKESDQLFKEFRSPAEDLKMLDKDHDAILSLAEHLNKSWSSDILVKKLDAGVDVVLEDTGDSDVIDWGDVVLSDSERDVLSLGPGFMKIGKLNRESMRVEQNVAMTKIRWTRMKD